MTSNWFLRNSMVPQSWVERRPNMGKIHDHHPPYHHPTHSRSITFNCFIYWAFVLRKSYSVPPAPPAPHPKKHFLELILYGTWFKKITLLSKVNWLFISLDSVRSIHNKQISLNLSFFFSLIYSRAWFLGLPFIGCMTFHRCLNPSKTQFFIHQMGIVPSSQGCQKNPIRTNVKCLAQYLLPSWCLIKIFLYQIYQTLSKELVIHL